MDHPRTAIFFLVVHFFRWQSIETAILDFWVMLPQWHNVEANLVPTCGLCPPGIYMPSKLTHCGASQNLNAFGAHFQAVGGEGWTAQTGLLNGQVLGSRVSQTMDLYGPIIFQTMPIPQLYYVSFLFILINTTGHLRWKSFTEK